MPIPVAIAAGVFDLGKTLIDRLITDPKANAEAQLKLMELDQTGRLTELQLQMSAILAEANSADPWTSRARPSFLYLFYAIIAFMTMVAPAIGIFYPDTMDLFFMNVGKGFTSIPQELWWAFSVGYLGYAGTKSFEAVKGVRNPGK